MANATRKFTIKLEIEVECEDRTDALLIKDDMINSLNDTIHPLYSWQCQHMSVEAIRQHVNVSPQAMTGAQIITGLRIYDHPDYDASSMGRFQLGRITEWTKLLNAFPNEQVKQLFLDNILAVWTHTDHPGWCWIQTHA